MKTLCFFLALSLQAANTYYVSSTGNDSNPGTAASPWLTLAGSIGQMNCGDTLIVVANGSYVNDGGPVNLPVFPNCAATTTIQSSNLASFNPPGYRTNPAIDSANYGKITLTSQGISAAPAVFTFNAYFSFSVVSFNASTNTVTITAGNGLTYPAIANGSQVEFEVNSQASNFGSQVYPVIGPPGGLSFLTHYYVVNCSGCGAPNTSFQLAATPGGDPLPITSCGAYCPATVTADPTGTCSGLGSMQYNPTDSTMWACRQASGGAWTAIGGGYITAGVPTEADTSANTMTVPVNYGPGHLANGMGVAFSAAGFQTFGTLPAPLSLDAIYYVENLNGNTFQVASTPGGAPIPITSLGSGMVSTASVAIASNWAFRGLELEPNGTTNNPYYFFGFGSGRETSQYGMVHNMEVDRCYLHDNPPFQQITHGITDNGLGINVHDSWIIGADASEAQAILGTASLGPTIFSNNFLEAAGEISLYGGDWSPYSPPNANKLFTGNYFYKPPIWKISSGTANAAGPCLYDATDPTHVGGEWYTNTTTGQVYQCNSSGVWAAATASLPSHTYVIKNMSEHKNGRYISYIGNLYNYSISQDQSGQIWNNSMEYGSGPGMANDHITIQNNAAYNSFTFMTRASQCYPAVAACPILPGNHLTVNNLLVTNPLVCGTAMNPSCGYSNSAFAASSGGSAPYFNGDGWNHNTIFQADSWPFPKVPMYTSSPTGTCGPFSPPPVNLMTYQNSLVAGDWGGDCTNSGGVLQTYYTNSTFSNNVLKAGAGNYSNVGSTNRWTASVFPPTNAAVAFVAATGAMSGDYHLSPSSPYSATNRSAAQLSNDGTDVGADIDLINMVTSGAASGTPSWDVVAGLQVDPGSSKAVLRYTAPTSDPCTATVYNALARIPANQVASAADNAANSVSNVNDREILVSGLRPTTQYTYRLSCGAGVLMVGKFSTRALGQVAVEFDFDWNAPTQMQYSPSPSMSGAVSLAAATRQLIPVGANSVVYAQLGAAGPIRILVAP